MTADAGLSGEAWAGIASAAIAFAALLAGAAKWREVGLRRDEVLSWALASIRALQTVHLLTVLGIKGREQKLDEVTFDTSILVEHGRIFFKNQAQGSFGVEKPPAYRGLRPIILDQLVIGHQIACHLSAADEETRFKMRAVAEDALRWFVSYVQTEIGRDKPASKYANMAGYSVEIENLLSEVKDSRIDAYRRRPYF